MGVLPDAAAPHGLLLLLDKSILLAYIADREVGMIQINMLQPKGQWLKMENWRGIYTFFFRQKGQMFQTAVSLTLWGDKNFSKSFYTAKKVKRVVYYQQN